MAIAPTKYRGFRVTRGDATGEQLAILVPTDYRVLHVASAADEATDWAVANPTHPTVYVHSETTPATDYVAISHDGTTGLITSVGGTLSLNGVTNVLLQVGGTSYVTLSATALTFTTVDVVIPNAAGLIVGSATQVTVSDGDGSTNLIPEVQALGVGTAFAGGAIVAATFNTTNTRVVSPKIILLKGAAATQVATTAVADNEVVGSIIAYGSDSADFETPVAAIEFVVDDVGAPTTGQIGGSLEFSTTADGGETLTLGMTLNTAQNLIVGAAVTSLTISNGDGSTDLIPRVQVNGLTAALGTLSIATFNTTNDRTVSPHLAFVKGAAATQVATTAVADNEVVGSIIAYASDSGDFETPVGAIEFVVDDSGGPGANAVGGSIEFYTTADGGTTLTIALTLSTAQLATFAGGIQGNTRADIGITGTTTGILAIDGATSGTVSVTVAATAGTWTYTLPATAGEAGDVQVSDGTGIASWVSGVRSVDVQLTNAQLLALLGTDVTLVAAPGVNRAIVVHAVYMFFDVTTTAYTLGSAALAIGYGSDGADIAVITEAGWLDTVADAGRWYQIGAVAATPDIITPVANTAVVMRSTSADMTGGNAANTLSVRVYYSVVDTVAFT